MDALCAPRQGPAIGKRLEVVSVSGTCDMHGGRHLNSSRSLLVLLVSEIRIHQSGFGRKEASVASLSIRNEEEI
jgi:hypothetical protein